MRNRLWVSGLTIYGIALTISWVYAFIVPLGNITGVILVVSTLIFSITLWAYYVRNIPDEEVEKWLRKRKQNEF